MEESENLYQEIVLEHGYYPRNRYLLDKFDCHSKAYNPLCGDKLELTAQVSGEKINKLACLAEGCVLSIASASLMTQLLEGKEVTCATQIARYMLEVCTSKPGKLSVLDEEAQESMECFARVKQFPARVKCVTMSWHAVLEALSAYRANQEKCK